MAGIVNDKQKFAKIGRKSAWDGFMKVWAEEMRPLGWRGLDKLAG